MSTLNQFISGCAVTKYCIDPSLRRNTLYATPEKLSAAAAASAEMLMSTASVAFSSAERLCALNLNTARSTLEELGANANALLGTAEPQQMTTLAGAMVQSALQKYAAYARNVFEILSQAQGEVGKTVEAQFADISKTASLALDEASKNAPQGSDAALSAMKSMLAAASSAYDSVSKAAKQAAEMATANVAAATDATVAAISTPTLPGKGGKKAA
ncbi:MAG: phasin family protein [Rhodocyclaceae bacterium]|nr:phasin family protein [Rhodocyclaceae bacterium]MBX3667485.1 phasin family protein [Rhodocyclaceae bacterium]